MFDLTLLLSSDRVIIAKNPIVPIKDRREPNEETVFQKENASG